MTFPPTPPRSADRAPTCCRSRSAAFAAPPSYGLDKFCRIDVACPGCTSLDPTTALRCDGGARFGSSTQNTSFEMTFTNGFTTSSSHIGSPHGAAASVDKISKAGSQFFEERKSSNRKCL